MNKTSVLEDFDSLPPEAQQQVLDFISFLQTRYKPSSARKKSKQSPDLTEEAFIGMWRDRKDMQNSRLWVRENRQREW
jgi:hypothetical protein